ncbi:MAG: VWA domain-containing protein [Promethearchaeota archaeon]|jgi:Mg-chelatase subunit ChlD
MLKPSWKLIPKLKTPKSMPLVGSLSFNELDKAKDKIVGRPIICTCGAALVDRSLVKMDSKLGFVYNCPFCGTLNVVDQNDLNNYPDYIIENVDFVIEEPEPSELTSFKGVKPGESVMAIIDVSGSMSGGKLEAVKQSLVNTLNDLKENAPNTSFSLITFESNVRLFSPNPDEPKMSRVIATPKELINSKEKLEEWFANIPHEFSSAGDTHTLWTKIVRSLRSGGSTALGTALIGGLTLLKRVNGGRVVLLTDGYANIGIGSLSGPSVAGKQFYSTIAIEISRYGITVEVVGVVTTGSRGVGLQILGDLAMESGGDIYEVTTEEIERTFSGISGTQYIGRNVTFSVSTPSSIALEEVTGISARQPSVEINKPIPVGSVTSDREIYFQLEPKKKLTKSEIPIQTRIAWTDQEGKKRMRVITQSYKTTDNIKDYTKNYKHQITTAKEVQKAGEFAYKGDLNKSARYLEEQVAQYEEMEDKPAGIEESLSVLKEQINRYKDAEKIRKMAPSKAREKASLSFAAAGAGVIQAPRTAETAQYGKAQMRMNLKSLFKKEKKKKK